MTHNSFRYDGKIALITGGTSGMGLATARRLLAEGARVIITGRDRTRLDAVVAELGGRGAGHAVEAGSRARGHAAKARDQRTGHTAEPGDQRTRHAAEARGQRAGHAAEARDELPDDAVERAGRVLGIPGDAADLADLTALAATIRERFGRVDLVFANAGIGAFQAIDEVTEAEFARVVDINFKSVFFTVQQMLPLLSDRAAVVINASFAVHRGAPDAALYTATKAAVHSLARTVAAELAPRGIRVNSISPGYIDTPAFRAEASAEAQAAAASLVAAGRIGDPDEIAAAVAFLGSDEAAYINGQDLSIDGGLTSVIPAAMV
ncbi:SDR family oxidoreductase [Nocardia otitidiscaviarum]|uniref:SDR family oxidoreductase n=1 Tax=Nocardia otitidiscaviarum TaxID=1823 RepID=UPI001E406D11|nr:SDR family oxidoreductase [Nocardia otitidiscaviarum]